jgi:hypothetical protein
MSESKSFTATSTKGTWAIFGVVHLLLVGVLWLSCDLIGRAFEQEPSMERGPMTLVEISPGNKPSH